jgi:hypothetical protein
MVVSKLNCLEQFNSTGTTVCFIALRESCGEPEHTRLPRPSPLEVLGASGLCVASLVQPLKNLFHANRPAADNAD